MDNKNAYGAEKVLPREMFERSELVKLTEYGDGIVAFDIDAPCGFSSDPGDVCYEQTTLLQLMTNHPEDSYVLDISGDSMIDADLHPGDSVIVDTAMQPMNGDVVLAWVGGGNTVKYFYHDEKTNNVVLVPGNDKYPTIEACKCEDFEVRGVVVSKFSHVRRGRNLLRKLEASNQELLRRVSNNMVDDKEKDSDLVDRLVVMFDGAEARDNARQFLKDIEGMKNSQITKLVSVLVKAKKINRERCHKELWEILVKEGLYSCSLSNWNSRI